MAAAALTEATWLGRSCTAEVQRSQGASKQSLLDAPHVTKTGGLSPEERDLMLVCNFAIYL